MKRILSIAIALCLLTTLGCASSRKDLFVGDKSDKPATGIFQSIKEKLTGAGGRDRSASDSNSNTPGILTVKRNTSGSGSSLISEIYSSGKCEAVSRGGFIWMTDKVLLADLLSPLDNAAQIVSKVNFETQGALMVDFGATPTPAYNVALMTNKLQLDGAKAIVQVDLVKPAANGKKMAQVVAHPCALYVLPRVGYSTLEVQSELGDVFTTFPN